MKKLLAVLLTLALCIGLVACGTKETEAPTKEAETTTEAETTVEETTVEETSVEESVAPGVMTYAEYKAAELDAAVIIECYVQAHQSWWDNKITVYGADQDGAYFMYNLTCSEEEAALLTEGVKIRVSGFKAEWAGEVEIAEGATFEFVENADTYVAEAKDLTEKIAAEDLIDYQNQLVTFKGVTVKAISFKDNESDKDIYLTVTKDDVDYNFCVENYLTGPDTDVYKAVAALTAGDKIDVTGFLYWYNGMNPHVTAVQAAE